MDAESERGRGGWGFLLLPFVPVLIVLVMLLRLFQWIFRIKDTVDRTPAEVEAYLDDFLNHRGGPYDWDDFTSVPITDPVLDALRAEACSIPLPCDAAGIARLAAILARLQG